MNNPICRYAAELLGWRTLATNIARKHRRPDGSFSAVAKYILTAIEQELCRLYAACSQR
jgi:hypothetical protein